MSKTGPTSYASPSLIRVDELSNITEVLSIDIDGGYKAEVYTPAPITGNQVAYRVYYQTGVSGTPLTEVAAGTDLSAQKVRVVVVGY